MDDDDIPVLVELDAPHVAPTTNHGGTVPLTIICGFLGAGKSTLIRRILSEKHGYRIAVIMNEFGDTADIEAKTINVSSPDDPTADQSEEVLELANGCLCCSIKDSGAAAIEKLMQRKGAFDHILLETTGLADPGPIASMFWQNEEFSAGLGRDIHLDGVVCVVDAVFGKQQMEEDHSEDGIGESLRQIACADVILLNKTDLVPTTQLTEVETMITQTNPTAVIHRTVKGDIDLKHIMGIDAYSSRPIHVTTPHTHECAPGEDHEHEHPHHYEVRGISSLQLSIPPLSSAAFDRLDEWILTALWENHVPGSEASVHVLRCKGMFRTVAGEVYVLQGVRNLYEIAQMQASDARPEELEVGKLILIGKGLGNNVEQSLVDVLKG